jgi:hypothetical protein
MTAAFCCQGHAGGGVARDRAQGRDRPGEAGGGGVLPDAARAVVHDGGELREETGALGITGLGNLGSLFN